MFCPGRAMRIAAPKATRVAAIGLNYVWMERAFVGFLIAGLVGTYWGLTAPYLYAAMLWCSSNLDLPGASERASTTAPRR